MAAPSTNGARPWADLPPEMVDTVVSNLDIFSTARLTGVCASWARAVAANTSLPFGTPCLLKSREEGDFPEDGRREISDDDKEQTFDLVDLRSIMDWEEDAPYPAFISAVRNRWWVGAKGDWLATVDDHSNAQLVNPYTGEQIDLPAIATILDVESMTGYVSGLWQGRNDQVLFSRIIVCETPSGAGNDAGYLVIAVITSTLLVIARGGDQSWTVLNNPPEALGYYSDAIVHKGKVFAVSDNFGHIYAWDLRAGACPEPELVEGPPIDFGNSRIRYWWNLAESADGRRLLLACTYGRMVKAYRRYYNRYHETTKFGSDGFSLYELNVDAAGTDGDGWSRVTSLGDRSLFIGANYPLWARVKPPVRPNCVYITQNTLFGRLHEDYDVQMFDLGNEEDGERRMLLYLERCLDLQVPIWFRPTLQMHRPAS